MCQKSPSTKIRFSLYDRRSINDHQDRPVGGYFALNVDGWQRVFLTFVLLRNRAAIGGRNEGGEEGGGEPAHTVVLRSEVWRDRLMT